jgi:hypothetical protein
MFNDPSDPQPMAAIAQTLTGNIENEHGEAKEIPIV